MASSVAVDRPRDRQSQALDRTLFFAARPFRPSKNVSLAPRVPMSTFSKPSEPMLGVLLFEGTQKYKTRTIEPCTLSRRTHTSRTSSRAPRTRSA